MFYIEVEGTHYEMGVQTGKALKLGIASSIDFAAKKFRFWSKNDIEKAKKQHMKYTEELYPELLDEVKGISDGSGFDYDWVYLASFYATMFETNEGCSNVIFTDTPDGPVLAKTNDLPVHEGKHSMLIKRSPKDGMAFISSCFIGTVWGGTGINEKGLAIGGSSCSAAVPLPGKYINPHCLNRYLLYKASTVDEALGILKGIPLTAWGANIAIADKAGNAVIVEKAGDYQGIRYPQNGVVMCTNHSMTEEMLVFRINDPEKLYESTQRYETIERFSEKSPKTVSLIKEILAYNKIPGALCRYGDNDPRGNETEGAYIYYPKYNKMEVCFSHADRDPWFEYRL